MPRLGGDALWAILRGRPEAPPILILSGYAPAVAQGPSQHVLAKPFGPAELLNKVREVLGPS
jgi:DNA-binding response OmpR family regulator